MSDLLELPDQSGTIDLDEYRKQRESEGTWPLSDEDHREYWKKRAPWKPRRPEPDSVA